MALNSTYKVSKEKFSRYYDWSTFKFDHNPIASETQNLETQKENIEALLSAVNNSSHHVRNFYIVFLLASIYIAIIIWSTTDVMLLKETPVTLPLLNVELPISGFYAFAPYFFLLLHFNLLLQLSLLADKLRRFDSAVSRLENKKAQSNCYARMFPFAFTHTLIGRQHSELLKFLLTLMVWITIIILPLGLLISLQTGFLPYHSEQILYFQRWAIATDLLLLTIFWPIIRAKDGKWLTWVIRAFGLLVLVSKVTRRKNNAIRLSWCMKLEGIFHLVTLFIVIAFSWGVAVLPDSNNEKWVAKWISGSLKPSGEKDGRSYFWLTEYLFDRTYLRGTDGKLQKDHLGRLIERDSFFHRNIRLREKLLIATELGPEDQKALTNKDESVRNAVMHKIIGLTLRGRDLRYAIFTNSLLPQVDFREINGVKTDLRNTIFDGSILTKALMTQAQLQNAHFTEAQLQGAILQKANLQGAILGQAQLQSADLQKTNFLGASLWDADLQGANLREANLQNTYFSGANLQDASLFQAQLQSADLGKTNFQGAKLMETQLQNANFHHANLQGADLGRSNLQGSSLVGADLQGADLQGAYLQGADLGEAKLQGAKLMEANFQGARLERAQLHGADLREANLQGADLRYANLQGANLVASNLTLSDLTETTFGKMPVQDSKDLLKSMSGIIKDPKVLKHIKGLLSYATKHTTTLDMASGEHIWNGNPSAFVENAFKKSKGKLKTAKSSNDYHNTLAAFLIKLSCYNSSVATRFINNFFSGGNRVYTKSIAQCLLELKDITNPSGLPACPGVSGSSKKILDILKRMASTKRPYFNKFQATFTCESGVIVINAKSRFDTLTLQ